MRAKGRERKRDKAKISRRHDVHGNRGKTLRRKAGAMAKKKPTAAAMPVAGAFTVRELAAAKRLILLSGSSTSSSSSRGAVSAASSGSSVNAPPAPAKAVAPAEDYYLSDEELEDDSQEVPGIHLRTKLYRLVSEIYQVTKPMEEEPANKGEREGDDDEDEEEVEMRRTCL